jgi:alkaline phosphatase D
LKQPPGSTQTILGARAIELALIAGNKNIQFVEWVDHGYGIVDLNAQRAIFEYWWQDKLTKNSPDVLGRQMVSWAEEDTSTALGKFQDQIDDVAAHQLAFAATSGTRVSVPAPLDLAVVLPR